MRHPAGADGTPAHGGNAALALFDLDGTITRHDTLVPYVAGFLADHPRGILGLPLVLATLARCGLGTADQGVLKSALIRATLGGRSRADIEAWTARFVPRLIAHGLFAAAQRQIARHREAGDHLVLLSASTDLYVPEVGCALGFAQVVCTGVQWRGDTLIGNLTTPNRRGAEKVRCLERLRAAHPAAPVVAYANAGADIAHLALADRGFLVNGSAPARRRAAGAGITCLTWR